MIVYQTQAITPTRTVIQAIHLGPHYTAPEPAEVGVRPLHGGRRLCVGFTRADAKELRGLRGKSFAKRDVRRRARRLPIEV